MLYWVLRVRFWKRCSASSSTVFSAAAYSVMPTASASDAPTPQISMRELVTAFLRLANVRIVHHFMSE